MELKSIKIENFTILKDIDVNLERCPVVIYGDDIEIKHILWSIILYIEGYNIYYEKLKSEYNNSTTLNVKENDILTMYINGAYTVKSLLSMSNDVPSFVGKFNINGNTNEINIRLTPYNILIVDDMENNTNDIDKIDYIHMYNLCPFYDGLYNNNNIYNCIKNIRMSYITLDDMCKEEINNYMKIIFDDIVIENDVNNIYIKINNKKMEIMFQTNDVQKVFTSLILLYKLICRGNQIKYYLIEEPEMYLSYYKMKKYISILKDICNIYDVNLIMGTNDNYIIGNTETVENISNIVYVVNNIKKIKIKSSTIDDIKYIDREYLLIVEGSDEIGANGFFTKLRNVYPILENFYMIVYNRINEDVLMARLSEKYKVIIYITDAEFKPRNIINMYNSKIKETMINVYNIVTDLPSSESYLILDYFKKSKKEDVMVKLNDYFKKVEHKEIYIEGLKKVIINVDKCLEEGERIWNKVLLEIKKEFPDYDLIISVIHGHSWVKMIRDGRYIDIHINNSKDWYKKTDFKNFDPSVKSFLDNIINNISIVIE